MCVCVCQFPAESQVNNNSTQNSLSEEQRAEAETLKTDGMFFVEGNSSSLLQSDVVLKMLPSSSVPRLDFISSELMCFVLTAGNDQMKVENFSAAVEFYSKAIAINPQNAVYYCNRSVCFSVKPV